MSWDFDKTFKILCWYFHQTPDYRFKRSIDALLKSKNEIIKKPDACVLADRIDSLQKLIVTEFFSASSCRDDIALQQVLFKSRYKRLTKGTLHFAKATFKYVRSDIFWRKPYTETLSQFWRELSYKANVTGIKVCDNYCHLVASFFICKRYPRVHLAKLSDKSNCFEFSFLAQLWKRGYCLFYLICI